MIAALPGFSMGNAQVWIGLIVPFLLILAAQFIITGGLIFTLKRFIIGDTASAEGRLKQVEGELSRKEVAMRRKLEGQEQEFLRSQAESEDEIERKKQSAERDVAMMRERIEHES